MSLLSDGLTPVIHDENAVLSIKKIIKDANRDMTNETISFSCDSSSALNAILSLAELINYSLVVYEHVYFSSLGYVELIRYFWLAPIKITQTTPYLYSPKKNIESFSLGYAGESLTTVLNVKSHNIGNENISLLPTIPARFSDWFQSSDWANSIYRDGFYEDILNGTEWTTEGDNPYLQSHLNLVSLTGSQITQESNFIVNNIIHIPIISSSTSKKIQVSWWDSKFKFSLSDNTPSVFYILYKENNIIQSQKYTSNSFQCQLKIITDNDYIILNEGDYIPERLRSQELTAFLIFPNIWNEDVSFSKAPEINLFWYADVSQEEREFAQLADKIPWLENKIFNFDYFLKHNITTPYEYNELMQQIKNNLRIVNGQLLCYAKEYYNSLQTKVELIASLESSAENLHASLYSDGIVQYEKQGFVSNFSDFVSSYSSISSSYRNYYTVYGAQEIQNNYFTKFFNAQQRFLKNIYEFTRYFNTPISGTLSAAYEYKLELLPSNSSLGYLTFTPQGLKQVAQEADKDIRFTYYKKEGDSYSKVVIVHEDNFKNFYIYSNAEEVSKVISKKYDETVQYLISSDNAPNFIKTNTGFIIAKDSETKENKTYYVLNKDLLKRLYYYNLQLTNEENAASTIFIKKQALQEATSSNDLPQVLYLNQNWNQPINYQKPEDTQCSWYSLLKDEANPEKYKIENAPSENPYQFYLNCGGYDKFFNSKYSGSNVEYFSSPASCLEAMSNLTNNLTKNYDNYYKHRVAISNTLDSNKLYKPYQSLERITITANSQTISFDNTVYWSMNNNNATNTDDLTLIQAGVVVNNVGFFYKLIDWQRVYFASNIWEDFTKTTVYKDDLNEFDPFKDLINQKYFADICANLYYIPKNSFVYNQVPSNHEYSSTTQYFYKENDNFILATHFQDITASTTSQYYTINNQISFSDWGSLLVLDAKEISFPVYLHQFIGDTEIVKKYSKLLKIILPISMVGGEPGINNEQTIQIIHDGIQYSSKLIAKSLKITDSNTPFNNGSFWFKYIDSDKKIYQEKALMIEQQLTEYWAQAYSASKYCDFFLPEKWTLKNGVEDNKFFNQIFTGSKNNLQISNTFIPQVDLVIKNETSLLQNYQITYDPYHAQPEVGQIASQIEGDNLAFQDLAISLFGSSSSMSLFKLTPLQSTKSYYYPKNGGIRWKNLLKVINSNSNVLDGFSGLYGLMFKWSCSFMENELSTYTSLQNKKENIWRNLHHLYPHLFFEGVFEYPTATTSRELYEMANYYFKEKSRPETNYSITVLDAYSLKGYNGEELKIGHPILVDAREYTSENASIKNSIDQYLFITDISYDLRSDTNINLTVNSIKYDDKLIQKLAKLIR